MRRFPLRLAAALLAAAAGGGSLASAAEAPCAPPPAGLPQPALDAMEPVVRKQLETARAQVEALTAAGTPAVPELAEAYGELGRSYLLYNLVDAAEAAFRSAHATDREDFRWLYYLGFIYQEDQRLPEAQRALECALAIDPGDRAARLRSAQVRLELGDPERAAELFAELLADDPESAAARYGLGQIAAARERWSEAAAYFEAVVARQPQASAAHYQLGLSYRELGDMERARAHLAQQGRGGVHFPDPLVEQLRELASGAGFHLARGSQARANGDLATAVEAFGAAVEADPGNLAARQSHAAALAQAGRLQEAVVALREVLALKADDASTHYNLGTALAGTGDVAGAEEHLRRAVELAPEMVDARVNLGMLLEDQGRTADAEPLFRAALERDPQDGEVRLLWARSLGRLGRPREAAAALRAVLDREPDNFEALLGLGTSLESAGESEEAIAVFRRLVGLLPPAPILGPAHLRLGNLLAERHPEEALEHLDEAARLLPGRVEPELSRAAVLARSGRFGPAADLLGEVLAAAPENRSAAVNRAIMLLLAERYPDALAALEADLGRFSADLELRHIRARLLAACPDPAIRDGARALTEAESVLRESATVEHAETMAMALAEVGRFEDAARLQQQIVEQVRSAGRGDLVALLEGRLASYRAGRPVRAPWLGN